MEEARKLSTTVGNNGTAARIADNASSSAHSAIDKVSSAVKPAVDRIADGAHQAVDKFAVTASDAAESLSVKANQLRDGHARMTEECRGYVRAKPLASLGIALAAGFVLSRLISSR